MENATRVQARLGAVDIIKFSECSVGEEVDRIINTLIHIEHLRELLPKISSPTTRTKLNLNADLSILEYKIFVRLIIIQAFAE